MRQLKPQATRKKNKHSSQRSLIKQIRSKLHNLIANKRMSAINKLRAASALCGVAMLTLLVLQPQQGESGENRPSTPAVKEVETAYEHHIDIKPLPLQIDNGTTESKDTDSDIEPQRIKVRDGDSMSTLFARVGLGSTTVHRLAYESEHGKGFRKLKPGTDFLFFFNASGEIERIRYQLSELEYYEAEQTGRKFKTSHQILEPDIFVTYKSGVIENSFYLDGLKAGLNDNLIIQIANIFGWDIDFALGIREGDEFAVVYEERYLNGEHIGHGKILAAEFINRGKTLRALRYENPNGQASFFDPNGLSMRKAFLRAPLDVFRISSHFNLNRRHPVLNTIRAHKGTDYAAPRGTPIRSAGAGKVVYAARQGGYGKVVKIQHGQAYKTVYAHMDRYARGIRKNKQVKQGQIIGYVGSTGLATGPHLHYEFHVNGQVRNPVTVKLPNGEPIAKKQLTDFQAVTREYIAMLEQQRAATVAASRKSISPSS